MPQPTPMPKFITAKGAEPRYFTDDYDHSHDEARHPDPENDSRELQQKNPKDIIYQRDITCIRSKWEDCSKTNKNVAGSLVKLWNGIRPKDTPFLQH